MSAWSLFWTGVAATALNFGLCIWRIHDGQYFASVPHLMVGCYTTYVLTKIKWDSWPFVKRPPE